MYKSGTVNAALWPKISLAVAILLSLFLLSAHPVTGAGQNVRSVWSFKTVLVFNAINGNLATVTRERYDKNGGEVELHISGNAGSTPLCPGGSEKHRFVWRFTGDASQVVSGSSLGVDLSAQQVTANRPCTTELASRSYIHMRGSEGIVWPTFAQSDHRRMDGARFNNEYRQPSARADGQRTPNSGGVRVMPHESNPDRPLAWFEIYIETMGGVLRYVYLYELGGSNARSGESRSGASISVEDNTDRPGGDYRNFDLPQPSYDLCRSACAADSNCRAYTYVKPGVQGANARCWLKSSVPPAGSSGCCISGVKR